MRRLVFLISFTYFFSFQSIVLSQTYDVTFQVDMNQFEEQLNYGNVFLNSNFDQWCGGCRQMSDYDNDGIWTITIPLSAGTYEYKFTLDAWTDQEWFAYGEVCTTTIDGFVNRSISVINENITLPVVCYSECNACINLVYGCTYETAINFNELATEDDMTCEFNNSDNTGCESDLNNDGVVSTADLLLFLVSFSQLC